MYTAARLPGVVEGDMLRKNEERKHGTSRGSPRRKRTAKAGRISCRAVKSHCAWEWGGWGRISVDGPGQQNPDRSEGPWGRAVGSARTEVPYPRIVPDSEQGVHGESSGHEGQRQTRFSGEGLV